MLTRKFSFFSKNFSIPLVSPVYLCIIPFLLRRVTVSVRISCERCSAAAGSPGAGEQDTILFSCPRRAPFLMILLRGIYEFSKTVLVSFSGRGLIAFRFPGFRTGCWFGDIRTGVDIIERLRNDSQFFAVFSRVSHFLDVVLFRSVQTWSYVKRSKFKFVSSCAMHADRPIGSQLQSSTFAESVP